MPGIAFIAAATLASAAGLVWVGYELRGDGGGGRARCRRCGYDMSSVQSTTCPECGRVHRAASELRATRRSARRVALSLGATMVAGACASWPLVSNANPWSMTSTRTLISAWPTASKLGWSSSREIENQLKGRVLSESEALALSAELVDVLGDSVADARDEFAGPLLMSLLRDSAGNYSRANADPETPVGWGIEGESYPWERHLFAHIGERGAPFVPALLRAARASAPCDAASMLSAMAVDCPQACDALIELIGDDSQLGGHAQELLLTMGTGPCADRLLGAVSSGKLSERHMCAAIEVLRRLPFTGREHVLPLARVALAAAPRPAREAADLLAQLAPTREEILPLRDELIALVLRDESSDAQVKIWTCSVLAAPLTVEDLAGAAPGLESSNPRIRALTAGLFLSVNDTPELREVLAGVLPAEDPSARACAYWIAARLRMDDPRVRARAEADAKAFDGECAESARALLLALLEPAEYAEFWASLLGEADWRTRELACDTLARLGSAAAGTVDRIRPLTSDTQQWVAKAAARAVRDLTRTRGLTFDEQLGDEIDFAKRRGTPVDGTFAKYLADRDHRARAAALARIGVLLEQESRLDLLASMSASLDDDVAADLIGRLVELSAFEQAAELIVAMHGHAWGQDRSLAISAAIAKLTPEQAAALRDPLVVRLRARGEPERAREIIGAVEAMATVSR